MSVIVLCNYSDTVSLYFRFFYFYFLKLSDTSFQHECRRVLSRHTRRRTPVLKQSPACPFSFQHKLIHRVMIREVFITNTDLSNPPYSSFDQRPGVRVILLHWKRTVSVRRLRRWLCLFEPVFFSGSGNQNTLHHIFLRKVLPVIDDSTGAEKKYRHPLAFCKKTW